MTRHTQSRWLLSTLCLSSMLLVAGSPALASDPEAAGETGGACTQTEMVVGASCPVPETGAVGEGASHARAHASNLEQSASELPIYIPPSRGTTTARMQGTTRGVRRPGNRL